MRTPKVIIYRVYNRDKFKMIVKYVIVLGIIQVSKIKATNNLPKI